VTTPVQIPAGPKPAELGRRALWLALAALVMTYLLPIAGLILGVFALATGLRARRALRADQSSTGTALASIAISAASLLMGTLLTAGQLYFSEELAAYTECKKGAGTHAAEAECLDALERAMEKKIPFYGPGELQFPVTP
jgi:Flp pilus assembly protein CpaB